MKKKYIYLLIALSLQQGLYAQQLPKNIQEEIGMYLTKVAKETLSVGTIRVDSVSIEKRTLQLFANTNCSYIPFRKENVEQIYSDIRKLLPKELAEYQVQLITDRHCIEDLIPLFYKNKKEKKKTHTFTNKVKIPLVTCLSTPFRPENGLQNRHIALWQSHGYYYESKLTRWEWQRARIFQTVEDLYTQSYVLPYLVPMLENAGANVLLPRERDTQTAEIIVDNDKILHGQSAYIEKTGKENWNTGIQPGFAHIKETYINFENPFKDGTYREIKTIKKGDISTAEWIPDIPSSGKYAVYVSYQTVKNSTDDARYTIYHKGGTTEFRINQQMGGGTWIYLGHFHFDEGCNADGKVVLSNLSSKNGQILTADAVKIGGGYGNIARRITEENKTSQNEMIDYPWETSGYPRFTEAARYWLQWAGIPDSIYSESKGKNDYTDDYKCRGMWVNYLAGGSPVNPEEKGLNIPIDMAFAFHSDAGTTMNDSIIGTLGIFCTVKDEKFSNGVSRYASRDLTDLIQSNIVNDIRTLYEPKWSRRGMWNQSYFEARVPKVPTMLLELLSHQNFADMRYGLDPRFRFTVSRAVYKGILKFLSSQYKTEYIVQPLPVDHFSIQFTGDNEVELNWQPVTDPLEPTALPDKYIVYTRIGNNDFDNGKIVEKNSFRTLQTAGQIYSYKVTAINNGGESFPSEILSASRTIQEKGVVLVINGFDRISAPADFVADSIAGFYDEKDHGVPYKEDISYIGSMVEFRRKTPWMDDDAAGFGASRANYETQVIAGNSFDYPFIHGKAITDAGYSFVSCSNEAVENQPINLQSYSMVDLILGKQYQTKTGRGGVVPLEFKTFSTQLQTNLTEYCENGGNLFISGAYVASDLWDGAAPDKAGQNFATQVLKYKWRTGQAAVTGQVKCVASPYPYFSGKYNYYNELNSESYVVESPDALEPVGEHSFTIFRYSENNLSAGIAYKGKYKTCVLGFPFESIKTEKSRAQLMNDILQFFSEK